MNPLQGMAYIQQQGELGRQRGQQNRLAALASQAYAAPVDQQRGLVQQAIATDPNAGFGLGKSLQDDKQQRLAGMSQKARMLVAYAKSGNRAGVDGLYPQIAQEAQALGLGQNIPPTWDDSYLAGMEQLANIAMSGAGTPAGLQEFNALTQGLSAEDQLAARRIRLGLDGRASSAGYSQVKFTGSDGRERIGVLNGKTGQIDLPDGTSFNPQTGRIAPTQPMGAPAPSVVAEDGSAMPVTQFTGSDGLPINIGNDLDPHFRQQLIAQTQAFNAAPDGATAQLPAVNLAPAQYGGGSPFVGRRAEDEAAAKRAAELGVEMGFLPQRQAIETQGAVNRASQLAPIETAAAISRTRGTEMAKAESEALASLPQTIQTADETIALLTQALNHPGRTVATGLSGTLDPRNYAPGTDARDFRVLLDQIGGRAFLQAFESLKGGGQITEIEGRKATEAMARLNTAQSDEAFEAALKELIGIAQKAKTNALRRASSAGSGMYGPAPADAPPSNAIPAPGHTEGGYRFRGGNPADPSNWERV